MAMPDTMPLSGTPASSSAMVEPVETAEQGVLAVIDLPVARRHAGDIATGSDGRRCLRSVLGGPGRLAGGIHRGDLVKVNRRGTEVLVRVGRLGGRRDRGAALTARGG